MNQKIYLLIDYLNPEGNFAITESIDKINYNISINEVFKKDIEYQMSNNKIGVTSLTNYGRWIVIYQADLINKEEVNMYILDFQIDLELLEKNKIFSKSIINAIWDLQQNAFKRFSKENDIVALSFAETYEKILKPNFFFCDNDKTVLENAERLGVLLIIKSYNEGERVKVAIIDEKIEIDGKKITNVYAFIHFVGHIKEKEHENGYVYVRIFDLLSNLYLIEDLEKTILGAGGKFDKTYFMERFTKERFN